MSKTPNPYQDPHGLRILLVEDNPDGRETMQILLELLGHEVDAAEDGLRGVEKALAWHPEVAIIDIGLPKLDGYQVAQRLRSALGRRIFLIALTGYGRPEDREKVLAAGFDVHLIKPVMFEELCDWLAVGGQTVSPFQDPDSERQSRSPAAPSRPGFVLQVAGL
jgi:CheY-like chemotaxis protein